MNRQNINTDEDKLFKECLKQITVNAINQDIM